MKAFAVEKSGLDLSRDAAAAFFEADVDGDQKVSFSEFTAKMVPTRMIASTSQEDLRQLFKSVDTDGSGFISLDEFFLWTLKFAQEETGSGIEAVFRRYDKTGEGVLDASEFARAAEELGFGAVAHEVFMELDPDGSGSISHHEMMARLKNQPVSTDAKRFLSGLAFDAGRKAVELDTSSWTLNVDNKHAVREQLKARLERNEPPARASDLYRAMTAGQNQTLDRSGFDAAMARVGLPPKHEWLVEEIFQELDGDGSGAIGDSEMSQWIDGGEGRKARAKKLTLRAGKTAAEEGLQSINWNPTTLRRELQLALIRTGVTPLDLLRAWDKGRDGDFSKREFLAMMKAIVDDEDAWDNHGLREVVIMLFKSVAGQDKTVDVAEFQSWLQTDWKALKDSTSMAAKGRVAACREGATPTGTRAGTSFCANQNGADAHRPEPVDVPSDTAAYQAAYLSPQPTMGRSSSAPTLGPMSPTLTLSFRSPLADSRAWPSRGGSHAYARRWRYRPAPATIDRRPLTCDPPLPPWRLNAASKNGSHLIVREEAEGVRAYLRGELSGPKRVVCYYQEHRPPPPPPPKSPQLPLACGAESWPHRRPPSVPMAPFALVSRTRVTAIEVLSQDGSGAYVGRTRNTRP